MDRLSERGFMLRRTAYLAFTIVALGGIAIFSSNIAHSQGGVKNLVFLQPTTPGTAQSGHSNISGTSRAGSFVGNGAGLSQLNASNINAGTLGDSFLSSNVALKNGANTFTATNTFLGLTRMDGFVGIGTSVGASTQTRFQVNDNTTTGFGGMYVNTANTTASPFYGYATSNVVRGYSFVDGTDFSWGLVVGGLRLNIAPNGRMGFNTPASLNSYTFRTQSDSDALEIQNPVANGDVNFVLTGGNKMTNMVLRGGTGDFSIYNNLRNISILGNGAFAMGTLAGVGSEDLTVQSRNASGYGGVVARVSDSADGRPFYGYSNGFDYVWTYYDSMTDEFRIYNTGDRFRLAQSGNLGLQAAPVASANIYTETLAASGSKDGIRSFVLGDSAPFGVWGRSTSTVGAGFGVRGGEESTSAFAYGVFADGNTGATGTKSFMIDHPLDPTNKYLKHYTTESPTPTNEYSGRVTTDAKGYAWVELPEYFGEINLNFRYQLTVIDNSDDFVLAKVSQQIQNNRFQIRTNKPNVDVSWEVKADRNDKYVQREGAPSEVEKPVQYRGTYLDPISWGLSESEGELARRERLQKEHQVMQDRNSPKHDWRKDQKPFQGSAKASKSK